MCVDVILIHSEMRLTNLLIVGARSRSRSSSYHFSTFLIWGNYVRYFPGWTMMYGNMSRQTQLICFKKPKQFCIMPYFVKHPKPVATTLPYDGLQLPWDGLSSTVGGRSIVKNRARCGESRFATTTMRNSWQYVKNRLVSFVPFSLR